MRKRLGEIAAFFGKPSHETTWITSVTVESGSACPTSLFFALKGSRVDGHQFLDEVARRGGRAAVVSEGYRGKGYGLELLFVPDVQEALQNLAQMVVAENSPLIIGVTGTVGKTTTKEFLSALLMERFRVAKSPRNWNSQLGLPLAVLNWGGEDEILVLEMGMSQKGEIARLVEIAPPQLGVLTQVGLAHGAFFETVEDIARAKCELFSSKAMTHAFLNREVAPFRAVQELESPKTWFGPSSLPCALKQPHLLENLGGAVAVALHLGMTQEEILKGIKTLCPIEHRGQRIEKRGISFIDDAYNASPLSCEAALKQLPLERRKIAVLGAMRELGRFEEKSHETLARCAVGILDHLLCLGQECAVMVDIFKESGKPAELFEKKRDVVQRLRQIARKGDVVLVKGSNAFALWTLIEDF